MRESIYILGFMGSGKSTIGRELARLMKRPFVDLDRVVETETGLTISDIFETHGEAHFRSLERKALRTVAQQKGVVCALGGGAPLTKANRDVIRRAAVSVWLDIPTEMAWNRCRSETQRPLAGTRATFEQLAESRRPVYEEADIHIHCGTRNPHELAVEIIKKLKEFSNGMDQDHRI